MSHKDAGNYARKRSTDADFRPEIADCIRNKSKSGRISCSGAHGIAGELGSKPGEIGKAIDLMEIKVIQCQLGLFGYAGEQRNVVSPAGHVPDDLKRRILTDVKNHRISCESLWNIAQERGISKFDMTAACETMKQKICCCQLGTFY